MVLRFKINNVTNLLSQKDQNNDISHLNLINTGVKDIFFVTFVTQKATSFYISSPFKPTIKLTE